MNMRMFVCVFGRKRSVSVCTGFSQENAIQRLILVKEKVVAFLCHEATEMLLS